MLLPNVHQADAPSVSCCARAMPHNAIMPTAAAALHIVAYTQSPTLSCSSLKSNAVAKSKQDNADKTGWQILLPAGGGELV